MCLAKCRYIAETTEKNLLAHVSSPRPQDGKLGVRDPRTEHLMAGVPDRVGRRPQWMKREVNPIVGK